ncbi:MAG TPA: isochorismatase family protein [Aliidongia sp.]|uniref:isochorismatase family protein n=1 Tax=Aliidongia sp. TaxID=1914230 RepID=UPI002DDD1039|nr:isochorismatase family protein [Aliidongia sp.]HEV2674499.1 isochorismatase family protein [Aliidongia sp.]
MVEPMLTHNRFAERLRADDAVLAIVDGQTGLLSMATATDALRNNLIGLARLGHAFGLPTVLGVCADAARGSLLTELIDLFGQKAVSRRRKGGFWDDPASRDAVLSRGRHHLIVASLAPGFGVAPTALAARADGLDVHVVLDASAGSGDSAERIGLARMTAAGIHLTSWVAVLAELGATGMDNWGGNGTAAVRDNLDRYAALR